MADPATLLPVYEHGDAFCASDLQDLCVGEPVFGVVVGGTVVPGVLVAVAFSLRAAFDDVSEQLYVCALQFAVLSFCENPALAPVD